MIASVGLLAAFLATPNLAAEATREVARGECRSGLRDEIIVCGNRDRSSFRLPDINNAPFDPYGDTKSVMNERVGWAAQGDAGTQSCGPVGPGGWTGCMVKGWKESRDQTQWGKNGSKRH